MNRTFWVLSLFSAAMAALLVWPAPAAADNAPMWESPVGLTPGYPGTQVRMASERVDIAVVERGRDIFADVVATFDMLNGGPDVTMKVGFPSHVYSVNLGLTSDRPVPYSPVTFGYGPAGPAAITNFRVWTDVAEYHASPETIKVGDADRYGSRWFVWEMSYPAGQPVRVHVSYDQKLGGPPYVQPMYVLRTGALWAGTIREATVTMTAPDGGTFLGGPELLHASGLLVYQRIPRNAGRAGGVTTLPEADEFLGADQASEASETRLVWVLRDFKPTRDVGTTYISAGAWRALREAEAAVGVSSPSANEYLTAAQAVLNLESMWAWRFRGPRAILDRYATRARAWAWQSVALDPGVVAAWEAVGKLEKWFAGYNDIGPSVQCWPGEGVAVLERAVGLGSSTAAEDLEDLSYARMNILESLARSPSQTIPLAACPSYLASLPLTGELPGLPIWVPAIGAAALLLGLLLRHRSTRRPNDGAT